MTSRKELEALLEETLQKQHDAKMKLHTVNMNIDCLQDELNTLGERHKAEMENEQRLHQNKVKKLKLKIAELDEANSCLDKKTQLAHDKISSLKEIIKEKKESPLPSNEETTISLSKSLLEITEKEKEILQEEIEQVQKQLTVENEKKIKMQASMKDLDDELQEKMLLLNELKARHQTRQMEIRLKKDEAEDAQWDNVDTKKKGNSLFSKIHDYTKAADKENEKIKLMIKKLEEDLRVVILKRKKLEDDVYINFCQEEKVPADIKDLETTVKNMSLEKEKLIKKLEDLEETKRSNMPPFTCPQWIDTEQELYDYFSKLLSEFRKKTEEAEKQLKVERFITVVVNDQLVQATRELNQSKFELQRMQESAFHVENRTICNETVLSNTMFPKT